jgi:hypothetical protein
VVYQVIREVVPFQTEDEFMAPAIEAIYQLIHSGRLLKEVNRAVPHHFGVLVDLD